MEFKSKNRFLYLYVILAVFLIVGFQAYWLYTAYKLEENTIKEKVTTRLAQFILEIDARNLLSSDSPVYQVDIPTHISVKAKDSLGNTSIRFFADDEKAKVLDSFKGLSAREFGSVFQPLKNKSDSKIAKKFITNIRSDFPDLDLGMQIKKSGKTSQFPENFTPGESFLFQRSQLNPKHLYTVYWFNPFWVVIKGIQTNIYISIVYLLICLSALYWLVKSIRFNKLLAQSQLVFTRNMTHELKTPLATLSATIEALDKYNFIENPQTSREYLKLMQQDVITLNEITTQILTNFQISQQQTKIQLSPLPLKELIDESLLSYQAKLEQQQAVLEIHVPENLSVIGNRLHLKNVFANLIDNALKYSSDQAKIEISAESSGKKIKIYISDNGIGIPKAYQEAVFSPYFRVDEGDLHNTKGYGIGLNYAFEVLKKHNGNIRVAHSKPNHGTTIELVLPAHEK